MLFNSGIFLLFFLPITLIGYQLFSRFGRRPIIAWLAFASVVFYSWWNWHFAFVLLGSVLVNFTISHLIAGSENQERKKFWMISGIALNLGALCYYKYLFHLLTFFDDVLHVHHG